MNDRKKINPSGTHFKLTKRFKRQTKQRAYTHKHIDTYRDTYNVYQFTNIQDPRLSITFTKSIRHIHREREREREMLPAGERGPEEVVIGEPVVEHRHERLPLHVLLVDGGGVVGLPLLPHLLGRSLFPLSLLLGLVFPRSASLLRQRRWSCCCFFFLFHGRHFSLS